MEFLQELENVFGKEGELEWWQMALRAAIVFLIMVVIVRLGGHRAFAEWSAFDIVVSIMLGSILSRAITGNAPFLGTLVAGFVLILCHRLVGLASQKSDLTLKNQHFARFVISKSALF